MITAKEMMSRDVVAVPENMGIRELATLLNERMITGVPVVDEQGHLVGVVSSMDIVRYFSHQNRGLQSDLSLQPAFYLREADEVVDFEEMGGFHIEEYDDPGWVSDIMTPVVFEVNEDTPLPQIAAMMVRGRIHRVIVTQGRRVVGIVTSLDVLKAVVGALRK